MKTCRSCCLTKSFEDFHVKKKSRDGRVGKCKDCYSRDKGHKKRLTVPSLSISDVDLAYLAGLIDGEGHLGMTKIKRGDWYRFHAKLVIGMATPFVLELHEKYGRLGTVRKHVYETKHYKDRYDWWIPPNGARALLPLLLPHLRLKKSQAILLLDYLDLAIHKDRSAEYRVKVEKIYWQLRHLNHRGE